MIDKKKYKHERWIKHMNDNPWKRAYKNARTRCLQIKHSRFKNYGGRGIKFLMTVEDFKFLWFRDKAYLMKKPSIDRKENNGDYILTNCRYIEKNLNTKHNRVPWNKKEK